MPVIKSAAKKLRQSEKHRRRNRAVKSSVKEILDAFRKKPTPAGLAKAFAALDKSAKTNVIHPNKAGRQKSRLAKLLSKK